MLKAVSSSAECQAWPAEQPDYLAKAEQAQALPPAPELSVADSLGHFVSAAR
jgi:hypothetical protein